MFSPNVARLPRLSLPQQPKPSLKLHHFSPSRTHGAPARRQEQSQTSPPPFSISGAPKAKQDDTTLEAPFCVKTSFFLVCCVPHPLRPMARSPKRHGTNVRESWCWFCEGGAGALGVRFGGKGVWG